MTLALEVHSILHWNAWISSFAVAFSFVAVVISALMLWDAWRDWEILRERHLDNGRLMLVRSYVSRYLAALGAQLILARIAWITAVMPEPSPRMADDILWNLLERKLLRLLLAMLIVVSSLVEYRARREARRHYDAH